MITIYHNPRCRKSREGLSILENSGNDFQLRKYLEDQLSVEELKQVIAQLDTKAMDLVRKNEIDWKEHFKGKELTEDEVIKAMVDFPKLIERPILVVGDRAVVGRPPEKFNELLK